MWTDMFNYQYAMMAEHAKGIHGQQYKKEDLMELADFVKFVSIPFLSFHIS